MPREGQQRSVVVNSSESERDNGEDDDDDERDQDDMIHHADDLLQLKKMAGRRTEPEVVSGDSIVHVQKQNSRKVSQNSPGPKRSDVVRESSSAEAKRRSKGGVVEDTLSVASNDIPVVPRATDLEAMDKIVKSPYEKQACAEFKEPLFTRLKAKLESSIPWDGDQPVGIWFQNVRHTGLLYSGQWSEGIISDRSLPVIAPRYMILCIQDDKLCKGKQVDMNLLVKECQVHDAVKSAVELWNLQKKFPKIAYKHSKLGKKLAHHKCAIFVTRTFFAMEALDISDALRDISKSLERKVLRCLEILEADIAADAPPKKRGRPASNSTAATPVIEEPKKKVSRIKEDARGSTSSSAVVPSNKRPKRRQSGSQTENEDSRAAGPVHDLLLENTPQKGSTGSRRTRASQQQRREEEDDEDEEEDETHELSEEEVTSHSSSTGNASKRPSKSPVMDRLNRLERLFTEGLSELKSLKKEVKAEEKRLKRKVNQVLQNVFGSDSPA